MLKYLFSLQCVFLLQGVVGSRGSKGERGLVGEKVILKCLSEARSNGRNAISMICTNVTKTQISVLQN
jgi:hypothetical protein